MQPSLPAGVAVDRSRGIPQIRRARSRMIFAALACLAAQPAFGAETLRWKFKPGETLKYTMVQETTQGIKAGGQDLSTNLNQTVDLHWNIKSVSPEGVADMSQTIDRVRTKVDSPLGGAFEFDSQAEQAPEGPIAGILVPLLKGLVGAEFTFKMNGMGELTEVKVPQKLLDSLKNAGPAANAGGMFSEEGLKNLISQSSLSLPEAALEPGKSWDQKSRLAMPMIGTMVMDKTYTYQGPAGGGAGVHKIELKTKVNLEPAADSNVAVKITSQEGKGEFSFDPQAGRVVKSRIDDQMQMSLSVQGQNIEQTTKTVTTMELKK
ncbi:MAG: DUF6263 family protein [Isosphaeraceae bacterium]